MMSRFTEKLEQMLQRPVWVIDILPELWSAEHLAGFYKKSP